MFERFYETHINIIEDQIPKIFLYIPFLHTENNAELYSFALYWQSSIAGSAKNYKTPHIVIHRNSSEMGDIFPHQHEIKSIFDLKATPKNSVIYVLAHGRGSPLEMASSSQGLEYRITVQELVNRLKEDGFTPQLSKKIKGIKLFDCDENEANKYLAYNVALQLGPQYQDLSLSYYKTWVGIPYSPLDASLATYKRAVPQFDFISDEKNSLIKVPKKICRASDFKETITVKEVLEITKNSEVTSEVTSKVTSLLKPFFALSTWFKTPEKNIPKEESQLLRVEMG